ncbi:hypothetical protein ACNKHR_02085 [Shigella flexneri]
MLRSEAGSYRRDTRRLIRMHQLDKVEMVQMGSAGRLNGGAGRDDWSCRKVLQLLGLPYRQIILCTGDIGFGACKTYNLEVSIRHKHLPSNVFLLRVRDFRHVVCRHAAAAIEQENPSGWCLNGSGLAVGRTLVAVMENYRRQMVV